MMPMESVVDTAPSCCGRKASIAAEHTASGKQPADADISTHVAVRDVPVYLVMTNHMNHARALSLSFACFSPRRGFVV